MSVAHERINPHFHFDLHLGIRRAGEDRGLGRAQRVAVVVSAMTVQRLLRALGDRPSPDR